MAVGCILYADQFKQVSHAEMKGSKFPLHGISLILTGASTSNE